MRRLRERTGGEGRPDAPQGRHPDNSSARPGEVSSISASVTFEDGKTDLSASGRSTIADMTSKVKDQRWVVEIRGHAGPLETLGNVDRAFALSFERAMNVARAMVAQGARWEQLRVVAAGDKERLVPRTFSRDQDRTNQRVEIIQTQVPVPPDPYSRQSSAGDE